MTTKDFEGIINQFAKELNIISKGGTPDSFKGTYFTLKLLVPTLPEDESREISRVMNAANKQYQYLQAQKTINMYKINSPKREHKIRNFLENYSQ